MKNNNLETLLSRTASLNLHQRQLRKNKVQKRLIEAVYRYTGSLFKV